MRRPCFSKPIFYEKWDIFVVSSKLISSSVQNFSRELFIPLLAKTTGREPPIAKPFLFTLSVTINFQKTFMTANLSRSVSIGLLILGGGHWSKDIVEQH